MLFRIHKHFQWKVVFDQCSTNLIETISVTLSNLVTDNIVVYSNASIIINCNKFEVIITNEVFLVDPE